MCSNEAVEETETVEETEAIEETETVEETETAEKTELNTADIIRTSGLDGEVEEIEPAEPVSDDELRERLSEMYKTDGNSEDTSSDTDSEEDPPAEEKPAESAAPGSFDDIMNKLRLIRESHGNQKK